LCNSMNYFRIAVYCIPDGCFPPAACS
jgi:hypothetical protein